MKKEDDMYNRRNNYLRVLDYIQMLVFVGALLFGTLTFGFLILIESLKYLKDPVAIIVIFLMFTGLQYAYSYIKNYFNTYGWWNK